MGIEAILGLVGLGAGVVVGCLKVGILCGRYLERAEVDRSRMDAMQREIDASRQLGEDAVRIILRQQGDRPTGEGSRRIPIHTPVQIEREIASVPDD
jgi:hypothetical protein